MAPLAGFRWIFVVADVERARVRWELVGELALVVLRVTADGGR